MAKKKSKKQKGSKAKKGAINSIPDLVHSLVEKGANSVEEIHREIAALPVKVLEGYMPKAAKDIGKIQHRSIGAVYDTIREVNDEVERFALEVLEEAPKIEQTARQAASSARKAVAKARKTVTKTVSKTASRKKAPARKKATARKKTAAKKRPARRGTS